MKSAARLREERAARIPTSNRLRRGYARGAGSQTECRIPTTPKIPPLPGPRVRRTVCPLPRGSSRRGLRPSAGACSAWALRLHCSGLSCMVSHLYSCNMFHYYAGLRNPMKQTIRIREHSTILMYPIPPRRKYTTAVPSAFSASVAATAAPGRTRTPLRLPRSRTKNSRSHDRPRLQAR